VSCGETITTDTTLHHDLTNCAGNGLVVGGDDIRLNLNGHVVDGNNADDACRVDVNFCDDGVNNSAGHTGVTIKGGTIQEFDIGVVAVGASHDRLRELATSRNAVGIVLDHSTASRIVNGSATDNRFPGVLLVDASDHNEIRNNAVSGSAETPGIELDDSDDNRVEANVVEGNDQGIGSRGGDRNDFRRNLASHNFGGAIGADEGVGNRLRQNLSTDNGDGITIGTARDTEISATSSSAPGSSERPTPAGSESCSMPLMTTWRTGTSSSTGAARPSS
jgi:parallel beta-helix repeat protein